MVVVAGRRHKAEGRPQARRPRVPNSAWIPDALGTRSTRRSTGTARDLRVGRYYAVEGRPSRFQLPRYGMYAVYRVTHARHVGMALGLSCPRPGLGLGLQGPRFRTRPTPHPRRERLARTLESGLPARLRPTNRLLRSATDFRDFSIYVYNTWALDSGIVAELSRLASGFDHVGLISIDESMQDSPEIYEHVTFAVRIGFGSQKYRTSKNLVVAPLGTPRHFVQPKRRKPITEKD